MKKIKPDAKPLVVLASVSVMPTNSPKEKPDKTNVIAVKIVFNFFILFSFQSGDYALLYVY